MSARIATDLPIEPLIPEILGALAAAPNLVLEAPPGAGKTTRVPLALLDAAWAKGGKIIVLEPRRLAARGAAARMAAMLGEEVGETVGYRVRLDRKVGPKTRIEVVTTGLFLRQLQGDPGLAGRRRDPVRRVPRAHHRRRHGARLRARGAGRRCATTCAWS